MSREPRKVRGKYPQVLRQKIPYPIDRKPVGEEISVILREMGKRFKALEEYYDVEIGTPEWDALMVKVDGRFEGLQFLRYPGLEPKPEQPYRDLALICVVGITKEQGGKVTDAVRGLADQWKMSPRTLRSRYYMLTRPKATQDLKAAKRMAEAGKVVLCRLLDQN